MRWTPSTMQRRQESARSSFVPARKLSSNSWVWCNGTVCKMAEKFFGRSIKYSCCVPKISFSIGLITRQWFRCLNKPHDRCPLSVRKIVVCEDLTRSLSLWCTTLYQSQHANTLFVGYIGEFEEVDDHRSGKIVIQLNGRYVSEIIYFCPAYAYMIQN